MHFTSILKRSLYILAAGIVVKTVISGNRSGRYEVIKYDAVSAYNSVVKVFQSPLHFRQREFLKLGAICTGLIILFIYDLEISNWFRRKDKTALKILKDFGWYYGSPENHYAINFGFYLYGLLAGDSKLRQTGVLLFSSSAAAGILQTFSKKLIGRARPLRDEGKAIFEPFSNENSYYSFPSGHSILSFTTAYALATQFKNPLLKGSLLTFGSIAPVSRLWAGAHWITDAVASICISIPLVNLVKDYLEKKRSY